MDCRKKSCKKSAKSVLELKASLITVKQENMMQVVLEIIKNIQPISVGV